MAEAKTETPCPHETLETTSSTEYVTRAGETPYWRAAFRVRCANQKCHATFVFPGLARAVEGQFQQVSVADGGAEVRVVCLPEMVVPESSPRWARAVTVSAPGE